MAQKEIESKIQREGPALREVLLHANPLLRPDTLSELIPEYNQWNPLRRSYRLWSSLDTFSEVMANYLQHERVLIGLSGLSAVGKDATREEMERLAPGFIKRIVTATSRKPKVGENHGKDYYFYPDRDSMLQSVAGGEFIEHVIQGDRVYGLPKKSLADAMAGGQPWLMTHVEMGSGWPAIEDYFANEYPHVPPFQLHVFMLPEMSAREYFQDWLPSHRPADQVESRANRAAWEIYEAPRRTEFLVTNVMSDTRPTL